MKKLLIVKCKITNANWGNIPDTVAAFDNLISDAMLSEINSRLNCGQVSETKHLYLYFVYIKPIINFFTEVKKSYIITKGWVFDTAEKIDVIKVYRKNGGIK